MPTQHEVLCNVELPDGMVDEVILVYRTDADGDPSGRPLLRLRKMDVWVDRDTDGSLLLSTNGQALRRLS